MRLEQILFTQGFGTRHECKGLIVNGHVTINQTVVEDPKSDFDVNGLIFSVDGVNWPYVEKAIIAMNKPAGYECSRKPLHHPSVLSLLPAPLRNRGVQPVGRLDEDTTGLLILTDDGALIHRLTHPKKHVSKIYRVTAKHAMTQEMFRRLLEGVMLDGEREKVAADDLVQIDDHVFEMQITQGKYHQVKRMVAAVGNRVSALHRVALGNYHLPDDLTASKWRFIRREELI
ncbi:16S rRNA pseudouridine(516) synthase [Parasutterella secunda]|uniref:pseudouridine synthase n=1 Tax=Parasutterella secunda TaxID=626947 RepID=UPI0020116600|nr:16S rRNA pseudouridine(516) synthase [Parasutterella secunda]MCL1596093.1 16S rRNA pseudouridine(516) synthase [Parasutterella secunda]